MRFYPTSLSAALWIDPNNRKEDEGFFRLYLRRGDNVVDVGANIGSLTLLAANLVGERGKVVAIEPHPQIVRYLQRNIALNKVRNIQIFNFALGNKEGEVYFSDQNSDDQNSILTDKSGIVVPLTTMDRVCPPLPSIALLKIDVEGYEMDVLQGASNVLRKTKCIYFESWEKHLNKYHITTGQVITKLEEAGFKVFKQLANGYVTRVRKGHVSRQCENLIATRQVGDFFERTKYRFQSEDNID